MGGVKLIRPTHLLLAWFTVASAQTSKLSPDLRKLLDTQSATKEVDVLVQFGTKDKTAKVQSKLLKGRTRGVYEELGGAAQTMFDRDIRALESNPDISYVSLDRKVKASVAQASDFGNVTAGVDVAASRGLTGKGIGVAVIDSGISAHPDLAPRVVYRESFISGLNTDAYGHGTHVAGIIAGNGSASAGAVRGVAPGVNLIDLRALDAQGVSSDSLLIAALERAILLRNQYNIRVINLSVGRPIYESLHRDPLVKAVEAAWKKGITVVVAAGNGGRSGYASILAPANSPAVITVGAMKTLGTPSRTDDIIASYSSKGPSWGDMVVKPDLVAPGNLIVAARVPGSTLDRAYPANVVDSYYSRAGGTSAAAPFVAGAAALLLEADSTLTPDMIKARLMKSAWKGYAPSSVSVEPSTGAVYPATHDMFTVGAGYLDVPAALADTTKANAPATSPWIVYNAGLSQGLLVNPRRSLWDNSTWSLANVWGRQAVEPLTVAWGDTAAWGSTSRVYGSTVAWGDTAAWGSATARTTTVAWGETVAWGDTAAWGSSAAWGSTARWGTSAAWGSTSAKADSAAWGDTVSWGDTVAWGDSAAWGAWFAGEK